MSHHSGSNVPFPNNMSTILLFSLQHYSELCVYPNLSVFDDNINCIEFLLCLRNCITLMSFETNKQKNVKFVLQIKPWNQNKIQSQKVIEISLINFTILFTLSGFPHNRSMFGCNVLNN